MSRRDDAKLVHRLNEGLAQLWYGPIPPEPGGKFVDAITDELARVTGRFIGWFEFGYEPTLYDDGRRRSRAAASTVAEAWNRAKRWKRLAMYEDARGRRWVQRESFREQLRMVIKIEVVDTGTTRVMNMRNEDRSFQYVSSNGALLARLNGAKVAFFNATVNRDVESVEVEERIPDQSW